MEKEIIPKEQQPDYCIKCDAERLGAVVPEDCICIRPYYERSNTKFNNYL